MKFYQSIRFRIIASTLIFGCLLIFLNTATIFFVMGKGMSKIIDHLVSTEIEYFLHQYNTDKAIPLPRSKFIKVVEHFENLPDHIKERVKDLPPGTYSFKHLKRKPPVHVGIVMLPDRDTPYYIHFKGRDFFKKKAFLNPREILLILLGLLIIPVGIAGYFLSRSILKPMINLMDQVKDLDPENIKTQFSRNQPANEIGLLSQTIDTAMNRIKTFIQREKQFTRDASHELRTPLTIVKGAVEIMEQQPETQNNPLLNKPLQRISRSVQDMQTTIETFLWLAREESGTFETCRVAPVVKKAIEDNQYLIKEKDIIVKLDMLQDKSVNVKEEILYITVTNLIRNAFQFTAKGSVSISVDENCFSIQDTGEGIEKSIIESATSPHVKGEASRGFGLGLSIVSRLCDRFGWQLVIKNEKQKGTHAAVFW